MPTTPAVETRRLTLRPYRDDDVDALYRIQGDREAMRFTYWAPSRQECEERLRAYAALAGRLGFAPWTVVLRNGSRVIGWGGLNIDPFDPGWGPEVAYFLHPTCWGRGLATEIVQASLEHGFLDCNLDVIGAFARAENLASIRVLEKCGFRFMQFESLLDRNHYELRRESYTRRT